MIRDDNFLQGRLDDIWDRYFADIEQTNDVVIRFGRKARTRLGSIKQSTINSKQLAGEISNNKSQITNKSQISKPKKHQGCHSELDSESIGHRSQIPPLLSFGRADKFGMTKAKNKTGFWYKPRTTNIRNSKQNPTIITINGLFKDKFVPEFIIDSVIAHEMVHYAHGFASPHEKKYATPHAGGIIKKEMAERGLEDLFILQKKWLKKNWKDFIAKKIPKKTIRHRKRKRKDFFVFR